VTTGTEWWHSWHTRDRPEKWLAGSDLAKGQPRFRFAMSFQAKNEVCL